MEVVIKKKIGLIVVSFLVVIGLILIYRFWQTNNEINRIRGLIPGVKINFDDAKELYYKTTEKLILTSAAVWQPENFQIPTKKYGQVKNGYKPALDVNSLIAIERKDLKEVLLKIIESGNSKGIEKVTVILAFMKSEYNEDVLSWLMSIKENLKPEEQSIIIKMKSEIEYGHNSVPRYKQEQKSEVI